MILQYRAGYKYQTAVRHVERISIKPETIISTEFLRLDPEGNLTIAAGYAWDGPSGPTIDTKSAMRGSLLHDSGYQLLRLGLLPQSTRGEWDALYEKCCIEDGMSRLRAWAHFKALRAFGGSSASPTSERPILTAP